MERKVAVIAIIVENENSVNQVNEILHEHSGMIIGRMGVPYRSKGVNIISIAIDASPDEINELAGQIGNVGGVTAKTVTSHI